LLALWLVAWLGVPPLLKWQAQTRLGEALGRTVSFGDVSFKPWTLELTVNDITVAAAPAAGASAPPLLHVARVHVDAAISSIFRRAPVIEALEIDAPQLRVARTAAGHYDIDDLLARFKPESGKPAEPSEPMRFALYNLQVRGAQMRFDDGPAGLVHQVEGLQLALPFLSNLPAQVEIKVEPRLAFKLNGAAFDSGAQATPFAQTRRADLKLRIADLDLAPYLGYVPESLPVRATRGSVAADLVLHFAASAHVAPSLALEGSVGVRDLALSDRAGAPLLAWQRLQLGLRDVQPLARRLAFGSLRVDGAVLHLARDAKGRINLLSLATPAGAGPDTQPTLQAAAVAGPASAGSATATAAAAAPRPWQASLDALAFNDARIVWNDAAVSPAAALQLQAVALDAKQLRWPIAGPMPIALTATLNRQGDAASNPASGLGTLKVSGPVTDRDAKLELELSGLALDALEPYAAQVLSPRIAGQVTARGTIDWSGEVDAPRLQLGLQSATLDGLRIGEGGGRDASDAVSLKQAALGDVVVDLPGRRVVIGTLKLAQPSIKLTRDRQGRINLQQWLVSAKAAPSPPPASSGPASPWRIQLKDFALDDGRLGVVDASVGGEPVRFALSRLQAGLQGLALDGDHTAAPARLQLSARIGAGTRDGNAREHDPGSARDGRLDWKGEFGLQPLQARGTVRLESLPVHVFEPYFGRSLPVALRHAEAGYSGSVALHDTPAGVDIVAAGDALLADVRVNTLPAARTAAALDNTDELLSWQSLAFKRLKITIKPQVLPKIDIGEADLDDFYSRLVVTEQGRFNLQDVGAAPPAEAASAAPPAEAASAAPAGPAPVGVAAAATPPSIPASAPPSRLPVTLSVGSTQLRNGKVDFSDHFIRPNYSAQLTELNGRLGAFGSDLRDMAALELHGKAAGTAILEISGALNPTVNPPVMDIHAKATDLELAPLSPYAGKYAGYVIERGKLTMDVAYKIDPDGKLLASNQVTLNQLTFGDRIESPDATKLPVLLAVALLKDRNGVIDINLPVSGSLNDPKFSVGGIILKVIVNLLVKAVTAPFALLSGGGSDDLSVVEFKPGTAQIAPAGLAAIDKVAKALTDRPALKMTVTGAADPAAERDAFQHAAVDARLLAERRREAARAGDAASAPKVLADDERARLLKAVYKDTDLPGKPRNLIGLPKDVPVPEMEAMLATHVPVDADKMRELALQRGTAVRDALVARGLPSERLFLAAPKLQDGAEPGAAWTPRVQLTLSTK
jgi:uncharacterized protein involved in outer membrane biogenesis